ncbi:hypothetical protein LWI29_034114 [Acer saccharum]|uniref:Uncharacterized protein n=1 Tax=Acer saccharum TaxID=4024 RepID=A0AA39S5D8_ACESA|nr:hypothetical protein LWI29_034114 [Acer saccharum]
MKFVVDLSPWKATNSTTTHTLEKLTMEVKCEGSRNGCVRSIFDYAIAVGSATDIVVRHPTISIRIRIRKAISNLEMKGGISVTGKRRWSGLVIGVLLLVILSMLVPLAFLLGLHNGFHSPNPNGYVPVHPTSVSNGIRVREQYEIGDTLNHSESENNHINDIVELLAPKFPKNVVKNLTNGANNETTGRNTTHDNQHKKGMPVSPHAVLPRLSNMSNTGIAGTVKVTDADENENCELKFGSYCLWRKEHREDMKDSMVKKLKDQLFVARAYYPSIAKLPSQNKLTRDMKQNIQELERVLSESATDVDLPPG